MKNKTKKKALRGYFVIGVHADGCYEHTHRAGACGREKLLILSDQNGKRCNIQGSEYVYSAITEKKINKSSNSCLFLWNAGDRVLRASGTRLAPTEAEAEILKLRLKDAPRSIKKARVQTLAFLWNAGDRT